MNEASSAKLPSLPKYPTPGLAAQWQALRVSGLVERPLALTLKDLATLPQREMVDDFRCEEGWSVPDQVWGGVPVSEVLRIAGPLPKARHVALSAGGFVISLTLEEISERNALLALSLNGLPLPTEHGGPCRLVVQSGECFTSVKWVDRIRVREGQPRQTGKEIALSRIGSSA